MVNAWSIVGLEADDLERDVGTAPSGELHDLGDAVVIAAGSRGPWHRTSRPSASFPSTMSMAMIRSAPECLAPWITLRPTPPQPITATVSPLRMSAVFTAAPKPVRTPQPMSAAAVSGMSVSIFTAPMAGMTVSSANVPDGRHLETGWPSRWKRDVMSSSQPLVDAEADRRTARPGRACRSSTRRTGAPTRPRRGRRAARWSTPSPTSSIVTGTLVAEHRRQRDGSMPFTTERSEWHTPDAPSRTRTSPAFGPARSMSTISSGGRRRCRPRPWSSSFPASSSLLLDRSVNGIGCLTFVPLRRHGRRIRARSGRAGSTMAATRAAIDRSTAAAGKSVAAATTKLTTATSSADVPGPLAVANDTRDPGPAGEDGVGPGLGSPRCPAARRKGGVDGPAGRRARCAGRRHVALEQGRIGRPAARPPPRRLVTLNTRMPARISSSTG